MNDDGHTQRTQNGAIAIHVGSGIAERERAEVTAALAALGPHLGGWDPNAVKVEVSVHDRGGKEQRLTLRAHLPGVPPLVAVSAHQELPHAIGEAKRELLHQIDRHKFERQPMSNRHLRAKTIRHPSTRD